MSPPPVHVVVPVYRGITLTRRCLDSLAASDLPADCQVTLIDDASPEDGMAAMLAAFVEAVPIAVPSGPSWELLRNAANLGFVASANRGMGHRPGHDVVLLNSDTEVPPGWLQRLRSAAYRRKDIGTVTPFSNCGSLASYPAPNVENALPANLPLERLDRLFQTANTGTNVDIPIGVGFCFFIRRDCLDGTGAFDEAAFGKGYGEENDFCLRASQRGWAHVLATDCFVYHKGRGSFGEEKDERVRQAYALLVERHPHYPALIQRHFADDPARPLRFRVDLLRLADSTPGIRLVVASGQIPAAGSAVPGGDMPMLQLSPIRGSHFVLRWLNDGEAFKLWFRLPEELDELRELLLALPLADVQGDDPSFTQALSALMGVSGRGWAPAQLFDLVARHSTPRFRGWPALQNALAALGLRLSGSRLLRPLATLLPQAVRTRVRSWIKGKQGMTRDTHNPSGSKPARRVLVVAHDAMLYGAQRSLLDMLGKIDRQRHEPYVVIPSAGPFTEALPALGIPFTCGVVQRWIFFPKPMSLRAIFRRPWRRLNHPYLLALLAWLTLPLRVAVLTLLLRRRRIDLVYTNTATILDGVLAARLCGIPHIWHLREAVAGNPDLAFPLPIGWLPGFVLVHSAAVIVNSADLARRLFGDAPPSKVKIVHNGIESAIYLAAQPEPPLPALPAGARLAAVCGALQERKDILTYIRSAAHLRDSHPGLHHLVIGHGHGHYLARIEEEIARNGLAGRVHLLGYRDDLPALLSRIDVMVSTAIHEPFGRTLIEAMAAGRPVVATRSGGPQEIIVDSECGFLADVGDDAAIAERLARLLDDAELYARMSRAARERVLQHFDLRASVGKIEDCFDLAPHLPKVA